jgi:F0F1-type ATP synthase membrane subunit a
LFFYILWNNLFGLFIDLFATVIPTLHHYLRPVTTDIIFNAMLAVFGVLWALAYGFKTH